MSEDYTTENSSQFKDRNKILGFLKGVIIDNKHSDKENKIGKVKVQIDSITEIFETDYINISTPMSGPDRGVFFLPEVGDQVLVGFLDGNLKDPVVIGSLWNKEDVPPVKNSDGNNNIKLIKTRSGHKLIFDDTSNDEKIKIITNKGHEISLEDGPDKDKIVIKDSNGSNSIELNSRESSISIISSQKIKLDAPNVEINANGNISIIANQGNVNIKGTLINLN
jgi:uncharacterized protein involved in type VI secretion and phage assembly